MLSSYFYHFVVFLSFLLVFVVFKYNYSLINCSTSSQTKREFEMLLFMIFFFFTV